MCWTAAASVRTGFTGPDAHLLTQHQQVHWFPPCRWPLKRSLNASLGAPKAGGHVPASRRANEISRWRCGRRFFSPKPHTKWVVPRIGLFHPSYPLPPSPPPPCTPLRSRCIPLLLSGGRAADWRGRMRGARAESGRTMRKRCSSRFAFLDRHFNQLLSSSIDFCFHVRWRKLESSGRNLLPAPGQWIPLISWAGNDDCQYVSIRPLELSTLRGGQKLSGRSSQAVYL